MCTHLQLVGKLRVRLSTLDPGRQITATLPVLADRRRSGRRVGSAILSLQLDFVSPAARLKAYFRPLLPDESYGEASPAEKQKHGSKPC